MQHELKLWFPTPKTPPQLPPSRLLGRTRRQIAFPEGPEMHEPESDLSHIQVPDQESAGCATLDELLYLSVLCLLHFEKERMAAI